jgi:hypothetical protein
MYRAICLQNIKLGTKAHTMKTVREWQMFPELALARTLRLEFHGGLPKPV